MTVGLLIITHHPIGEAILQTAVETLGECPLPAKVLSVTRDKERDLQMQEAQRYADELDTGDGLLVLTDIFGSTPSNIACSLRHNKGVQVVAGLNLPMLIRVFNYPDLELGTLSEKALSGGMDGLIAACDAQQEQ
jgi:PTS system mannose-specific IIA component